MVGARVTRGPLRARVAYTMLVLSPAARPAQTAFNQFAVAARSLMPFLMRFLLSCVPLLSRDTAT